MTRELNVRITLEEHNGYAYSNNAYASLIKLLLDKVAYVIRVGSVQVETVKLESEKEWKMRQYKFRAKRLDNGEWVYGDLLQPITQTRIVNYDEREIESGRRADFFYHDVDESTVGQFTGLTDKNGKEIYEGDIVRISISPTFETAEANDRNADLMGIEMPSWVNGGDIIARVSYFDGAFHYIHLQSYLPQCGENVQEPMLNYLMHDRHPDIYKSYDQTIEVIGNVFDNPELLTDNLQLNERRRIKLNKK